MGIQGLLPQLKSIMVPVHAQDLAGQTVAIDTYSWLHKGALSCSADLCKGTPTSKHIDYCMHRVNLLRHHGIKPILVFDGGLLPMKIEQENKRSRARKENLERAMEHEAAGNSAAAFECYQKAVDISPSIAYGLIQVLKREKVDYIVAPYEADAQMTFLCINKHVDAVITEDSDLIPFGCSRIIFKMDKFGQGVQFQSSMLGHNKDLDFTGFTKQMLLEMCIFSGCDYLQSLPGMGLKRAHALVQKFKSYEKAMKHLRYSAVSVPPLYEENFRKAIWAFQHQRVYDPTKEEIVHLSKIPCDIGQDLDFLGPWLPPSVAKGIAEGDLDPFTKTPFQAEATCTELVVDKSYSIKEFAVLNSRKRLDLPVQKNILTNYFCMASLEAKRKFRAPKVIPKHLVKMESASTNSESQESDSPGSAEVTTPTINCPEGSLLLSRDLCADTPSPSPDSMESNLSSETDKPVELPYVVVGNTINSASSCQLLEPKHGHTKPCLTLHKENGCNSTSNATVPGNSALDTTESKTKTLTRKVITKSLYFKHKSGEDRHNYQNENPCLNKEETNDALGDRPVSTAGSIRNNYQKSVIGKRKLIHAPNMHTETRPAKTMQATSVVDEGNHIPNKCADRKAEEKFGCNVHHVNNYSGIAEKSMEKFVSLISSFRYTSGSRASGLRPPLKDVQNTCPVRSTTAPIDLSKFAYRPNNSKTL